ncbi:MAG: hypothetical protein ACFFC1_23155, partial [Promethearchaeota archaeon]
VLNLIAFIATAIINILSTTIPLGYGDPGELSDLIPNLFVPAGLTFSIWGAIYFFLALFSIYQMRDIFKSEKVEMPFFDKIGILFIISSLANISWIFLWQYLFVPWSLLAMIVLLITLILIYTRLNIGKTKFSTTEKLTVQIPFSIYLGWITVATIANVTAVLVDTLGVPSFGTAAEIWTILVIVVAVAITYIILFLRRDVAYSLVIVWALLGIYIKQSVLNLTVATTALIALIVVLVGIILVGIKWLKK